MKLITYDLNTPGKNYQVLYECIKSLGDWWHHLDSTWLVNTTLSPYQIDAFLRQCIDDNDYLLVIEVNPSTAAGWLPEDAGKWISKYAGRVSLFGLQEFRNT